MTFYIVDGGQQITSSGLGQVVGTMTRVSSHSIFESIRRSKIQRRSHVVSYISDLVPKRRLFGTVRTHHQSHVVGCSSPLSFHNCSEPARFRTLQGTSKQHCITTNIPRTGVAIYDQEHVSHKIFDFTLCIHRTSRMIANELHLISLCVCIEALR